MSEIRVIKGNKIIRVTENELDKYLTKGYTIMTVPTKAPVAESEQSEDVPTVDTQVKRRRRK